jgi:hypothetical protein
MWAYRKQSLIAGALGRSPFSSRSSALVFDPCTLLFSSASGEQFFSAASVLLASRISPPAGSSLSGSAICFIYSSRALHHRALWDGSFECL